jgi:hypothetical protein
MATFAATSRRAATPGAGRTKLLSASLALFRSTFFLRDDHIWPVLPYEGEGLFTHGGVLDHLYAPTTGGEDANKPFSEHGVVVYQDCPHCGHLERISKPLLVVRGQIRAHPK